MRSAYRAALAVFAVTLAMGALASGAAATPEWYTSPTKSAPEWQQGGAKLTEAAATKWNGHVKLTDRGVPATIECVIGGEGSAGPGRKGKQTTWTLTSCTAPSKTINIKGNEVKNECEKAEKAEFLDGPWGTELVASRSTMYDTITGEGKTTVGFSFTCKKIINVTDTCTLEAGKQLSTAMYNREVNGVEAVFSGEQLFHCTVGGGTHGELGGAPLLEATKGAKLEANVVEGTYSKVASSQGVKGSGELTIEDKGYGGWGLSCPIETDGTIEAGGKGTITSYQTTGFGTHCKGTGECEKVEELHVGGLPWQTELYESGGAIRNKIGGGTEKPEWEFTCKHVTNITDRCSLNVSPEILNGREGEAFALFSEGLTKTYCSLDGIEKEKSMWRGELKLTPTAGGSIKAKN
jgi:hypothetical protein